MPPPTSRTTSSSPCRRWPIRNFAHTLTYVCEHNKDGALGIVVNKPIDMTLSALFEQIDVPLADGALRGTPVHFGGPVQIDRGFVLHRPLGNWQSTLAISDDLGLTTSKDVLEAVGRGEGPKDVLVSLGYAGWSAGQLEQEIAQNAWLTVEADAGRPVRDAGRGAAARGDAPPRHRLLAAVRRRRARVTLGCRADRGESTILAFDFGTRRIGVAVGNTLDRRRASAARPSTGATAAARFAAIADADRAMAARDARRRPARARRWHARTR